VFDIVELISQTVALSIRFVNTQICTFRLMRPLRASTPWLGLSPEHKPGL
jgi:hypothetical protein